MSWLSQAGKKIERGISNIIPHQHSADIRAQRQAMKEQMDLYKEQKDTLHKANEDLATQKKTEADRLHQKQIRSLRGHYRRNSGFMGSESGAGSEVKETLG